MDNIKKGEDLETLRARIFEKIEQRTHKLQEEARKGKKGERLAGLLLEQLQTLEELRQAMQTIETREELEELSQEMEKMGRVVDKLTEHLKAKRNKAKN